MEQPGAEQDLKAVGANKEKLINQEQSLSKEQMSKLFEKHAKIAISNAHKWIPNLDSHPKEVQLICIDMAYNMGGGTIMFFKNTGSLISKKQYATAATHMKSSKWYGQVGNRSKHHVDVVNKLGNQKN